MWVQAAYLLATAVLLIPLGRLADQHGRVRFYLIGTAVFTAGSLLAALSVNGAWLILSRVIQGGGAALMIATSAAIVTAVFPPRERGRALGINVMAVYIGLSIGPPLGGILADTLGWRSIFLINLPIGLVVLVWGWMMLPRGERAQDAPVLDLDLLVHNRLFAAANTAALLNYMALYGIGLLTAIFLEIVQDRSAALTGWLMLSQPLLMAALSPFAGHLSDRVGSRVLATGGMVTIAFGMVLLAAMPTTAPVWQVAADLAVVGLGMAAFSAPNTSAIMGSVRRDQLSVASAFLGAMRTAGMALSVALLGGIAASSLGAAGGRLLFTHGHDGGAAGLAAQAVSGYAQGYRYAMITGAVLALVGAAVSLTRGAHDARV